MNLKHLFVAVPALLILGNSVANAAETINDAGALACINDKWDEKEVDKGHKASRLRGSMHKHPCRSSRTEIHARLRGQVRVHARQELEGQRDLYLQI
jgi:hypothetical protein